MHKSRSNMPIQSTRCQMHTPQSRAHIPGVWLMVKKYVCNLCGSNDALAVYLALRDFRGKRFVRFRRLPFDFCMSCWDRKLDIVPIDIDGAVER